MSGFNQIRQNMVDCQIRPGGIVMPALLEACAQVPRELFVPDSLQNVAYMDEDMDFGDGRFMLEPLTHIRMVEALGITDQSLVLDVGGAGGYSAAILSHIAGTVVALQAEEAHVQQAAAVWEQLEISNIAGIHGALPAGCAAHAPYDHIIINGSVSQEPEVLLDQLRPGGRLVAIIRPSSMQAGQVTLFERGQDGAVSSRVLFEAGCPYLQGFEPQPVFAF